MADCGSCRGTGNCQDCYGSGKVKLDGGKIAPCNYCKGSTKCKDCRGSGKER